MEGHPLFHPLRALHCLLLRALRRLLVLALLVGLFWACYTHWHTRLADKVRAAAGSPMIPSSTLRCPAHNRAVGGVANSRHLTGKAMDFSIRGWPSAKTLALVKSMPETAYAYAIDEGHVHMDVV